jgi:hypothetical protein
MLYRGGRTKTTYVKVYWSDICLLTLDKNILIMKTFLGALSKIRYSALMFWFGV